MLVEMITGYTASLAGGGQMQFRSGKTYDIPDGLGQILRDAGVAKTPGDDPAVDALPEAEPDPDPEPQADPIEPEPQEPSDAED